MLSKNTCEGVHLIVKLPAICLQACKFTYCAYLLCFFLESFHGRVLHVSIGRGVCFSDGWGFIFKCGWVPHGGHQFLMGWISKKNCWIGGGAPMPPLPLWETLRCVNGFNLLMLLIIFLSRTYLVVLTLLYKAYIPIYPVDWVFIFLMCI